MRDDFACMLPQRGPRLGSRPLMVDLWWTDFLTQLNYSGMLETKCTQKNSTNYLLYIKNPPTSLHSLMSRFEALLLPFSQQKNTLMLTMTSGCVRVCIYIYDFFQAHTLLCLHDVHTYTLTPAYLPKFCYLLTSTFTNSSAQE